MDDDRIVVALTTVPDAATGARIGRLSSRSGSPPA